MSILDVTEMLDVHEGAEDEWGEARCVAHNEGLQCCLDRENARGKLVREELQQHEALRQSLRDLCDSWQNNPDFSPSPRHFVTAIRAQLAKG